MTTSEGNRADSRDLGFGNRAGGVGQRLLERDGSFAVRRTGMRWRDILSLYHWLFTIRWPAFLALLALFYLSVNAVFAVAYLICGPDAIHGPGEHTFVRCFFFSVETLSGVGYGHLAPHSTAANLVMTAESLASLLTLALATGLVFARFSRPRADIIFSSSAVVAPYRGGRALMIRIANRRRNQIINLEATVMLSLVEMRGVDRRRSFDPLVLERDGIAFFPLSWTIVHPIDESSPLTAMSDAALRAADAEVMVMLDGTDDTVSQSVHARSSYKAEEVVWGARFSDIFGRDDHGRPVTIDLARISSIEPA